MLLTLNKISKSYGAENISADIDKKDRIGIIGENGAGKTTLLNILTGEIYNDDGDFTLTSGTTVGYLRQNADLNSALNVYQEMQSAFKIVFDALAELKIINKQLVQDGNDKVSSQKYNDLISIIESKDGYNIDVQIKKVLNGMQFLEDTWEKPVAVLSGGERTRLSLSKMLLLKPDVLILDEPTNHLDFDTLQWLENHLNAYSGAMIIVSHDRYFLDAVVNHIWEIADKGMISYKGNYSAFIPQKEMAVELQQKRHNSDVEKAKKLQEYVDKNLVRASTTKMAQSRRKQLEKMEITDKPNTSHTKLKLNFEFDTEPYNEVLTIKDLTVSIGGNELIQGLNVELLRAERLIIAGPNGTGKSTLLKVIAGRIKPSAGVIRVGSGVKLSYFEQQQVDRSGTAINVIWDKYPKMTELEVRSLLARLGFRGADVFKQATDLSGGELARLRFAEIYLERANLLFLDEPTNHLDIYTRETVGDALQRYQGTLVVVTHDRYLMNNLACPILYIEEDKHTLYQSYDALMQRANVKPSDANQTSETPVKSTQNQKLLRRKKAENRTQLKDIEDKIEQNSDEVSQLEQELVSQNVISDHIKLQEVCDKLDQAKTEQNELYEKWEIIMEEAQELDILE